MRNLLTKIKNLISQAYYSEVGLDDESVPSGLLTTNGRDAKFIILSVYGVCSNPVKGSHVLAFNAQGTESNKFGIVNDFINRKKNLKEGEVALVNSKNGKYVFIKENGNVEILGSGDFAVRYQALETAFNALKADYNAHKHAGVEPGAGSSGATDVPNSSDIAGAKIAEIEVPS